MTGEKVCWSDIPPWYFHLQVKVQNEDVTFALKVIKKKHVVDNRQEEHIHSERKILAEARSPVVVKSVLLLSLQTHFHFLSYTMKLCSINLGKQCARLLVFDEITVEASS